MNPYTTTQIADVLYRYAGNVAQFPTREPPHRAGLRLAAQNAISIEKRAEIQQLLSRALNCANFGEFEFKFKHEEYQLMLDHLKAKGLKDPKAYLMNEMRKHGFVVCNDIIGWWKA